MKRFPRPLRALLVLAALFALPVLAHSQGGAGKSAAPAPAPTATSAPSTHPKFKGWINNVPDTGQFLADSVWLLRVGPRVSTVGTFIERWFAAYPPDRPGQDSTGRVEFLSSLMDKDVLGLTAERIGKPLDFEDRSELRSARQRALVYAVHKKFVIDSVNVSEQDMRATYEAYKYDQHLRHILVADKATADAVRRDLISGRTTWTAAVKKYSLDAATKEKDGDLGWLVRDNMSANVANMLFVLKPSEICTPLQDGKGWHIVQSVERRPRRSAPYEGIRRRLKAELTNQQLAIYTERLSAKLRKQVGMKFDTVNCEIASKRFRVAVDVQQEGFGGNITVDENVPEFSNADTARVLATWEKGGRYTIGDLVHAYSDIPPLIRPTLNVPEVVMGFVESIALEPTIAAYGEAHGLDKDPAVEAAIAKKTEELRVSHLFQDSVASRVWVSKEERKAYYEKHMAQYHTYASVDFAAIPRANKTGADSVAKALRSGATAQAILAADSAAHRPVGTIQSRKQNDEGAYHKALFEEMRPGDIQVRGPDREGAYVVIQLLHYDPGVQLSYQESEQMIDESLQNAKTDAALRAFIDRQKPRYAIAWRPELVTLIKLVDPTLQN